MNLALHLGLCGGLVVLIVIVGVYRSWLEDHGDHNIHLHNDMHDADIINSQQAIAKRLDMLDKLRFGMIIAAIVYAVLITAVAVFNAWNASNLS
jgi:hypothetical protein